MKKMFFSTLAMVIAMMAANVANAATVGESAALSEFSDELRTAVTELSYYPKMAFAREIEGTAIVKLTIDNSGTPVKIGLVQSANDEALDTAAQRTVLGAAQKVDFKKIPLPHTVFVPVVFSIKGDVDMAELDMKIRDLYEKEVKASKVRTADASKQ